MSARTRLTLPPALLALLAVPLAPLTATAWYSNGYSRSYGSAHDGGRGYAYRNPSRYGAGAYRHGAHRHYGSGRYAYRSYRGYAPSYYYGHSGRKGGVIVVRPHRGR